MPPPLRTKIVATLGPSCESPEVLWRMAQAGLSVARINMAHGDPAYHERLLSMVRATSRRIRRPLGVMVDLAGPKIRVGELQEPRVLLGAGRAIGLTARPVVGTSRLVSVSEPRIIRDVRRGDPIFLADGTLELVVTGVSDDTIDCKVVAGGWLSARKGVNLPKTPLSVPSLTSKDREDLGRALRWGVDVVAMSFVRSVEDVRSVRRLAGRRSVFLISKIERPEAVRRLEEIVDASDGVMVARGDLGVEMPIEDVPLIQKRIIRLANTKAKPVITATQMLKSMVEAPHPTRAEAGDVANAILDGTDAVMLSEETAIGRHPAKVVETMARIARRAEATLDPDVFAQRAQPAGFVAGSVSDAAVRVARDVGARAIVTPTARGATPRFVARLRPKVPVLALSHHPSTVQSLCLTWGVEPALVKDLGAFEAVVRAVRRILVRRGLLRRGDRFVLTAGFPPGKASNLMTVQAAED